MSELIGKTGRIKGTDIVGEIKKGRAEDDFPASLADGHPRLILAYVIIKGIQVHPSKVEVEE